VEVVTEPEEHVEKPADDVGEKREVLLGAGPDQLDSFDLKDGFKHTEEGSRVLKLA
jgi:hypothetical protein